MSGTEQIYDVLVIGGGINGVGIAYDAASRGATVLLAEQNDFASGTSSASSKLIHGGLRYLEHYEFRLVSKALKEREVLMQIAPHLVTPLRFRLPHRPYLRPAWLIRCGLFLYDHLSWRRSLPGSTLLRLDADSPLKPELNTVFEYSDCWTDDSRLVITNALAAKNQGATLLRNIRCTHIHFDAANKVWTATLVTKHEARSHEVKAKHIVNASGPWLNTFLEQALPAFRPRHRIRLIKGSHIIVPRIQHSESAYILQNEDRRIVFVLPYHEQFSLIGTTDSVYAGDPSEVQIEQWEKVYLLAIYNAHFKQQLTEQDIISSFAGVRPLCDDESNDPSAMTRDYTLDIYRASPENSLISIYGGKITTYRKLAEVVVNGLSQQSANLKSPCKTNVMPLPGTAFLGQTKEQILAHVTECFPWLPTTLAERYAMSYGLRADLFLRNHKDLTELGPHFGHGLYQAEVDYLVNEEWAKGTEDILWRRSKLGLYFSSAETERLNQYLQQHPSQPTMPEGFNQMR